MAGPHIVVDGVSKRFGTSADAVPALSEVSLAVGRREFCTVIGPSGCGKSTLLAMIGGLVLPDAGAVRIDGQPVEGPDPRRVAMVFQDPALLPWRTALDNVAFGLELRGMSRPERRRIAGDLLGPLGLREFAERYPRELSGGMRQRVAIARALAIDSEIVLMDEPFGALDEQTRLLMGEWLLSIWTRARKTVVFVTHSHQEALFLSTRVVALTARPGRVKSVLEVPLPYPRDLESPGLASLRAKLWGEIREESLKTMGR